MRSVASPERTGLKESRAWEPDDAHLVELVADGNGEAFGILYERYRHRLYRSCLAILRNPDDALDAVQLTMLKAFRFMSESPRELTVGPWLDRVARNTSISLLRQRPRSVELSDDIHSVATLDNELLGRERVARVLEDVSELSDRGREALMLRALRGLEYREIASAMDTSAGAARQAVFEARSALLEAERGRELSCSEIHGLIASGDGRRLRHRSVKAHLDNCESCARQARTDRSWHHRMGSVGALLAAARSAIPLGGAGPGLGGGTVGDHGTQPGESGAPPGAIAAAASPAAGGQLAAPSLSADMAALRGTANETEVTALPQDDGSKGGAETAQSPSGSGAGGAHGRDSDSGPTEAPQAISQATGSPGRSGDAPGHNHASLDQGGAEPGHSGEAPGHGGTPPGHGGSGGTVPGLPGQSGDAPGHGKAPGQGGTPPGRANGGSGSSVALAGGDSSPQGPVELSTAQDTAEPTGDLSGQDGAMSGTDDASPGQAGDTPGQGATPPGHGKRTPGPGREDR